ncbi:laminin subunit alpha-5-like [Paramacrobiotus metropolitanus]|uniref:laminin subunit alpha-5-like n=1 Tax=Paramacrobiotus metropolitanus TaxID=2943436 RepID=UPI002445968B|nr:laminin subunit alpha-5-like [Paramacrobiotus metropolitanus]
MWRILLWLTVAAQAYYVSAKCIDCAFGMCDTGPQFCDKAKQECACPTKKTVTDLLQERKCIDCTRIRCDTGPQTCDLDQEKCVCPKGGKISGEPFQPSDAFSGVGTHIITSGCIDCAHNMCDTGPQTCDATVKKCICPNGGKIPSIPPE